MYFKESYLSSSGSNLRNSPTGKKENRNCQHTRWLMIVRMHNSFRILILILTNEKLLLDKGCNNLC